MSNAIRLSGLIILLAALLSPAGLWAREVRPNSMLVLDQSDRRGPFFYQVSVGLRDALSAQGHVSTTVYTESLDLNRFGSEAYQEDVRRFLEAKYRDRPIGVVVVIGAAALELALRWRRQLWPDTPIVFAMVEEADFKRLELPAYVTGGIVSLKLKDAVSAARAMVPDLKTVAIVGAEWKHQVLFHNWKDQAAAGIPGLDIIEIVGRPMPDVIGKVATLPDHSAIIYTGLYSDGKGNYYPPSEALALIAAKANRPIIVASETFVERGGIGGFVIVPSLIGAEAARRALQILDGEAPENLPSSVIDAVKPIFNWQQMQHWNVSESNLPKGSEIRFREPTFLQKYRWRAVALATALLVQTTLIAFLLHERFMRRKAEADDRSGT